MIKFAKKTFSIFLAMVLLLSSAAAIAYAAPQEDTVELSAGEKRSYSGSCGPELTWSYNPDNSTLTISGTGEMDDYKINKSPWYEAGLDDSIEKIIVSEGVTSIGTYAFSDLVAVEKVSLPASLISIGRGAFTWCETLKDPVLPEGLLSIGDVAFQNCSNIQSIRLPASLISFGKVVFSQSGLKEIQVDENSESFSAEAGILYNKDKTELVYCTPGLPDKLTVRDSVKTIRESAFSDCLTLSEVVLPAGLEKIEEYAFAYCYILKKVTLSERLKEIGDYAFESCHSLTNVKIPANVTRIGTNIFMDCISLKKIEVDADNKNFSAQDGILYNKKKTKVLIAAGALQGAVDLPKTVTEIADSAFSSCENITSVQMPSGLLKIGQYAFGMCCSLSKVILPTKLTSIDDFAFSGCISLTGIKIPAGVSSIGSNIFEQCHSLKKIEVDADNEHFSAKGGILYNKKKTKALAAVESLEGTLTLPETVTEIGFGVFRDCENIKIVRMPSGLSKIGPEAFLNCRNLKKVVMSPKLTAIGNDAFSACESLEIIRMQGNAPELTGECGLSCDEFFSAVVYYPSGASGYGNGLWRNYLCKSYIPETGVKLDKTAFTLYTGSSRTLKASVKPSDAYFKTVTWKSSNPKIAEVSGKGVVKGLIPGKVTITATTDNGKTAQCEVTVKLAAPKLEKVSSAGYNAVKITWEKVSGASGYYVYRKSGNSWKKLTTITGGSTVSYKDSGLTCGKKYTYTVKAYRKSGDSRVSSSYDKNGISGTPVPAVPSLKSLKKVSDTGLKLTWGKVSGASGYVVYRKTGNGSWKKIKTIAKGSTVTYTDTGLKKGTRYTYTVKAYRVVKKKNVYSRYDKNGLTKTLK